LGDIFFSCLVGLIVLGMVFFSVPKLFSVPGSFGVSIIGFISILISWLVIKNKFLRTRDIEITESGVCALFLSTRWKSIAWQSVKEMEKIRQEFGDAVWMRVGEEIRIVGENATIVLSQQHANRIDCVKQLNHYAALYRIPLVSIDTSETGIREALLHVPNKTQRKKIWRTGVIQPIDAL
jgi:hypothetical protein